MTTAPRSQNKLETFIITHPFHPLFQQEYELVDIRQLWGLKRVYYYDAHKKLKSFPLSWTSAFPPDPFVICAEGRSPFHVQELLKLSSLLKEISVLKEKENV